MSIGVSAIFGFFLLISLLFSIQNFETTVQSDVGQPVVQILIDIFGNAGAIALMTLVIVCVWHCGLFSLTSNSRMMYGFSRDRGMYWFAIRFWVAKQGFQVFLHSSIRSTRGSDRPSVPSGSERFCHFCWQSPRWGPQSLFRRQHRLPPSAYIFPMAFPY